MKKGFQARLHVVLASAFLCLAQSTFAQGTAFTYQGRLNTGTAPANGRYDFRFGIYNAASLGGQQGGFLTNSSTVVKEGLFTVTLDFGAGVFSGEDRWLEIGVRTNGGGAFATLAPRQPLTPAPHAVVAMSASNLLGILPVQQLGGKVANSQLASNSIGILAGAGLSGGGTVPLGGTVVVQNAGLLGINGSPDITATTLNGVATLADTATSLNIGNMKVRRDAVGGFAAGSLTLSSNLYLPLGAAGSGIIYSGGSPFIYSSGIGSGNFFAGTGAGNLTMSGNFNTGVGYSVLDRDATGGNNTAYGYAALEANSSGNENVAAGVNALNGNQTGSQNVAVGAAAMIRSAAATANTAIGYWTLFMNATGSNNTAGGYKALLNTTGSGNTALGYMAGSSLAGGSSNIAIGHPGLATDTNIIRIGQGQTQTYIAGTINGDAGGMTNLNASNLTGLVPAGRVDDGGGAAYQSFQSAARGVSAVEPLPLGMLHRVVSDAGGPAEFSFSLDGIRQGVVAGFAGSEGMSRPYEFVVELLVPKGELVASAQLGRSGALTFSRNGRSTVFAGVVTACSASSGDDVNRLYTFRLEPPLAYLAYTSDYRISQEMTVPDVVSAICRSVISNSPSTALSGSYAPHASIVQFGETYLNFFNRLLEEEGIFYFFNHGEKVPGTLLADSAAAYIAVANAPYTYYGDSAGSVPPGAEYVRTFQRSAREIVGASAVDSYDFTVPRKMLLARSQAPSGRGELFEYGSSFTETARMADLARLREERQVLQGVLSTGSGNAPDLHPGYAFTLNDQAGSGLGGGYVVTSIRHAAFRRLTNGVASLYYGNQFEVIPATTQFRPARATPKPQALACTAVVVGPTGEEIYTDKYGRVKVLFHWDRYGAGDATSSGWIRVASPVAGNMFGMFSIPRVRQEVMVQFIQGDPDRPVITGSFYNGDNMPAYSLPANKTQSGIKTRSTKGGAASEANELRFEDLRGSEEMLLHAQKNMTLEAENDQSTWVGRDSTSRSDRDTFLSSGGGMSLSAGLDITSRSDRHMSLSAAGNMSLDARGYASIGSGGGLTITSALGVGINTTNDPAYGLKVAGPARVAGTVRMGSETGTSQVPNPAGLVVRRINSTTSLYGSVVAISRTQGGANINLIRDGTDAGFLIQYPASPGQLTIACMGIDATGAVRNFYTSISPGAVGGAVQIYSNTAGVVHFECTFGTTYVGGQHLTQVTLSRYIADNYWAGTVTSTVDQ